MYSRADRGEQLLDERFQGLRVGESSMQQCIESLGSPLLVRESGMGADLIWGWERNSGLSLSLSVPLGHSSNANLAYAKGARGARGFTLHFDQDWILRSLKAGGLQELIEMSSPPPQFVDDESSG